MTKQYTIADARRNLPTLVSEAEAGAVVLLTRRGRPVAVVVSLEEYDRLKTPRATFVETYAAFKAKFPDLGAGVGSRYSRGLRDRTGGRKVTFPVEDCRRTKR